MPMNSLKEDMLRVKEQGRYIRFKDTSCVSENDVAEGKIVEVGEDCAIIETQDGAKLYSLCNIVWLQILG